MTRKRFEDKDIVDIKESKKRVRILDLTNEYLKKRREIDAESID